MIDVISHPWPWWVAGPLIGLVVPLLLKAGGEFGVSENLRHICAALLPSPEFFRYDWRRKGAWNLTVAAGIGLGAFLTAQLLPSPEASVAIAPTTIADLQALGLDDLSGLVPAEIISWAGLSTLPGFVMIVGGGFLVGFGARYAGGCTSGHAISGLSNLQLPSLVAVLGFFVGGLVATHLILPLIL